MAIQKQLILILEFLEAFVRINWLVVVLWYSVMVELFFEAVMKFVKLEKHLLLLLLVFWTAQECE